MNDDEYMNLVNAARTACETDTFIVSRVAFHAAVHNAYQKGVASGKSAARDDVAKEVVDEAYQRGYAAGVTYARTHKS